MVFTIVTIIFVSSHPNHLRVYHTIDAEKLPLTFMTTVFTLPILGFERWDPADPTTPKPDGMLKTGYTFGVIGKQR